MLYALSNRTKKSGGNFSCACPFKSQFQFIFVLFGIFQLNGTSRQWAGRRRPRPSVQSNTATAAANISALAEVQKAYYAEKLAMDRAEHEVRMRVLLLQEEFEIKRLRKLEE